MSGVLLVYGRGGVPPSYAIPKVAAVAATHLLVVTALPISAVLVAHEFCSSVTDASAENLRGTHLIDRIVEIARNLHVDAVVTLSEFALASVARACRELGLSGPGDSVDRARNKRLMRTVWSNAGVPIPRWREVDSMAELSSVWDQLSPPLLLKAAWSAAALGQILIERREDIPTAWQYTMSAVALGQRVGFAELQGDGGAGADLIADELIASTTQSWFDDHRYGDHLSVEGLVIDGVYWPVCITVKTPTSAPFTERANLTPCVLSEPLQRIVEATARQAVDALELETCGTHTEMKLMADNKLCLLETAARFGGVMLVREVEIVHAVDMVGALVRAALGDRPTLPATMLVTRTGRSAGSVALYGMDSHGSPWSTSRGTPSPIFRPERIDWRSCVSSATTVEVVPDLTIPTGSPMPSYDPANGYLNAAGVVFLTAPDPESLLDDAYSIMDSLERLVAADGIPQ